MYGADFSGFESGNYFYQILEDADGDSIIHWRLATKGSGAHDGFWRDFCQFLRDDSALAANAKLPDANDYVAGTEDISRAILAAGGSGGIWLSAVRNEINYQQLHDVWLPLTRKITGKDLKKSIAFRKSNTIRLDNSQRKEPLETFTNISLFLSCLNIEIASHIAANSTVGKGFGQKYRSVKEIIAPALKI